MAIYKYKYIITSERVSYVEAEDEQSAKELVEKIMTDNSEIDAIETVEKNYVSTLANTHLGVDFGSFVKMEIDNGLDEDILD